MTAREAKCLMALAVVLSVFGSHREVYAAAPYPSSDTITGITWDWSTHQRLAKGSDNFAITWSDDDHQYAVWGDGWGFSESGAKQSLGVSRITGSRDDYHGTDLWGLPTVGSEGGKSYGIISVDGILYLWYGPGSNTTSCKWSQLKTSADHGCHWTDADWRYPKSSRLVPGPAFLNFGRDNAGSRDDYVYTYFVRYISDTQPPQCVDLARVPKDRVMEKSSYEFFAGLSQGAAIWTASTELADRKPVFEDPQGKMWNVSVIYNRGLGRYILCTQHTAEWAGNLGIFEAPEPWGPWKTVAYYTGWGKGHVELSTFYWNFSNKWTRDDGRAFTLIFTGTGSNDSWNTIKGQFMCNEAGHARKPANDDELRYWLENMVWYHRFTNAEITAATGLADDEIHAAQERFDIRPDNRLQADDSAVPTVLPYPGGRHPRIGFLEGAIDPQRETKFSVFTPWDSESYVVVDVPEAVWSNLGLTYLAHTHVETIWTKQNITLPKLEWNRRPDGTLDIERTLPNNIAFGVKVTPIPEAVLMEIWLKNGTDQTLSDLRVQNCVMTKMAAGFGQQTDDNKVYAAPYAACRWAKGKYWIITAWENCQRTWGNPDCPCFHSDPKFPDLEPGQTCRLRGWLSFYEGMEIEKEFARIEATGWRDESK